MIISKISGKEYPDNSPGFASHPGYRVDFEPSPRQLRVEFNGEIVANSTNAHLLHETAHVPVYYFPREDVRMDLMEATELYTFCPFKGEANYWTLKVGDKEVENALWSYEEPFTEALAFKDFVAFYWNKMDHWFEEDEEVFVHARDPYKRIDAIKSTRQVRVVLSGETLAETGNAIFLFETGMPVRYYLPQSDVRMDLLESSETTSRCPYKGIASYWSARIGDEVFEDIVWGYPDPIPEMPKIKDHVCFFNENVDAIFVDGSEIEKAETKWSTRFLKESLEGPEHIV